MWELVNWLYASWKGRLFWGHYFYYLRLCRVNMLVVYPMTHSKQCDCTDQIGFDMSKFGLWRLLWVLMVFEYSGIDFTISLYGWFVKSQMDYYYLIYLITGFEFSSCVCHKFHIHIIVNVLPISILRGLFVLPLALIF